jgi:putative tricarboxylic transport membrane protein
VPPWESRPMVALKFGPPEYFSIMILGLSFLTYLSHGSKIKAVITTVFGLCLGQIGMDLVSGQLRFTFGMESLEEGIGLIPIVMGLFGIGEVLVNLEESRDFKILQAKITGFLPNLKDLRDAVGAIMRGTFLGFLLGVLPGGGAVISSFVSYAVEKKLSKHPEKFGTGAIEAVAGPEAANNAATGGSFIPLFTLGIPSNSVMALLLGALMIHGVAPGPFLISEHPDIFWGTIMSMYIGNILLLVLNLPLIGLWVKLIKTPYRFLFPLILLFCIIGSYSVRNSIPDVFLMFIFGIIGYLFKKYNYEPAPLIMAFILGPMLETALRQSLRMSMGSFSIFFSRSISVSCLMIALFLGLSPIFFKKRGKIIANGSNKLT